MPEANQNVNEVAEKTEKPGSGPEVRGRQREEMNLVELRS
jgi:hypothetical protein